MQNHENPILKKTFDFSIQLLEFTNLLSPNSYSSIRNQLLKSGTSIGVNMYESQSAESRSDFIHKLKIASKECHETKYWLKLCQESNSLPSPEALLPQLEEINRLLNSIISTAKRNQKRAR